MTRDYPLIPAGRKIKALMKARKELDPARDIPVGARRGEWPPF